MNTTAETVLSTALQTASAVSAALAATDPKLAAVVAAAPLLAKLFETVTQIQQSGAFTPEQLTALYTSIGKNVTQTQAEWDAMPAPVKK